jgi:VanZ family protein
MWILRTWCKYWLPVVVWMSLIFVGSTDLLSSQRTSRFLVPLLRWIKPDMSSEAMQRIQYGIRKCGHVTEYAILCVLIWRARRKPRRRDNRPWSWTEAVVAMGASVLFAASDEIHQSFYVQRYGSAVDVMIDAAGAMLGVLLLRLLVKWRCSSGSGGEAGRASVAAPRSER